MTGSGTAGVPALAARVAPFVPTRLVAAAARLVYPRFEPELARLADLCPAGCGTAVDVAAGTALDAPPGRAGPPGGDRRAGPASRPAADRRPLRRERRAWSGRRRPTVRAPPGCGCRRATRATGACRSSVRRDIHARALEVRPSPWTVWTSRTSASSRSTWTATSWRCCAAPGTAGPRPARPLRRAGVPVSSRSPRS